MNYWEIVGLFFNLAGAIILAIPFSKSTKSFREDEDMLISIKETDGEFLYTTKRDKKNSKIALLGITFIILGFFLQLISTGLISYLTNLFSND